MNSKRYSYFFIACLMIWMSLTVKTYEVKGELETSQGKIFNGMYANYTFKDNGVEYNSTFKYTQISDDYYNVTWEILSKPINTWIENKQTRVISNSSGPYSFDDGAHAPIWIFTNLSIGNLIWIAVDAESDHEFNVTTEDDATISIGTYEVWVLLDNINSAAVYEKNTGLLIGGLFKYAGTSEYTLILTSTNVFSHYKEKTGIPGYNLFLLIVVSSILSLVILIKSRKIIIKS